MAICSGLITGLMGFSLKKEMLGDALFYREIQTFQYEVYSLDLSGLRPLTIQQNIYDEFKNKYSGDINVRVFNQPADYSWPNDSRRAAKFNVEIQVRSMPNVGTWQSELSSAYYKGLSSGFFQDSGLPLIDFKEGFDFETSENGTRVFSHNLSFGLLTGTKQIATSIASGVFANDKDTTFGIATMVGEISSVADTAQYRNYYTEMYDTLRNSYSFSRKREILPESASTSIHNLVHVFDLKDDGFIDVTEKGTVKGKLTFDQSQQGANALIATSYDRCNTFYATYVNLMNLFSTAIAAELVNTPTKITRTFNKPSLTSEYETTYTNNSQFKIDGTMIDETVELNDIEIGIIDIKHNIAFTRNKRTASSTFATLIGEAIVNSPSLMSGYFSSYDASARPIKHIKKEIAWPNRKSKGARVMMEYTNHPKFFVTINGVGYFSLEYKIAHTRPTDIITEYKIINRPTKSSVVNYAYQTEKGQMTITIDASIGRDGDEFFSGFRTDIGTYLYNLYQYATTLFFREFHGVIPVAFTYHLNDIKYDYTSENGKLQLTVVFAYSMKKHTPP